MYHALYRPIAAAALALAITLCAGCVRAPVDGDAAAPSAPLAQ